MRPWKWKRSSDITLADYVLPFSLSVGQRAQYVDEAGADQGREKQRKDPGRWSQRREVIRRALTGFYANL